MNSPLGPREVPLRALCLTMRSGGNQSADADFAQVQRRMNSLLEGASTTELRGSGVDGARPEDRGGR
ncbi:MAG: hypothetical protein AVDCRST_MAG68-255 [uncultured Gemmatimonadetes bacterium]|uniref:Uncharacterized protein n=1 Tax=uncultured Gemmatimonadota bacterium TaxID=203437 RepID=A0A6J4K4X0_9BACT|nr:MAG: hypothetical protein AVDCRST_MAG68-255 [uncultured Gemmatimonadota bacterium]